MYGLDRNGETCFVYLVLLAYVSNPDGQVTAQTYVATCYTANFCKTVKIIVSQLRYFRYIHMIHLKLRQLSLSNEIINIYKK